jgi:hypothetical protein
VRYDISATLAGSTGKTGVTFVPLMERPAVKRKLDAMPWNRRRGSRLAQSEPVNWRRIQPWTSLVILFVVGVDDIAIGHGFWRWLAVAYTLAVVGMAGRRAATSLRKRAELPDSDR